MTYLVLKVLHLVAVVLFLGNITTGLFWKEHADRTRDPRVIASMLEGIIGSDRLFTIPGVIVIMIGGLGAAITGHVPILRTGWMFWSIVLFSLSGLAFSIRVAPLQAQMAKLMRAGAQSGAPDWHAYHALSRRWGFWGAVALLAPAAALVLMVLKPTLPGL
ncbi:MAG: DUF2269 family protein [Candidatus Eisenbacteria bacterium]|mgnify:CR=1 FL=1